MSVNKFMFELNNTLYDNFFTNVEIHRLYIDTDDVVVIRILCEKYGQQYDYAFSVKRKLLDNTDIDLIIKHLKSI